jgi:glycosyltransferase involved in cell wall biosynthesis
MIRWADVVHLTGVYSPPTLPALLVCRLLGKPVVWSPRGSLQRWDRTTKPFPKKVWEWFCNALLSPKRCIVHVTSNQEEKDSKTRITRANFAVIQNGVDIPQELPARIWRQDGKLRLMYLGRLHPIKGIENLLRALHEAGDLVETLDIYGDGNETYRLQLQKLVNELGLGGVVHFRGHVDDDGKTKAFMEADVCVVPSYTENFGMVVAESLAHGVPVIASQGTPWSGLEDHDCGLWTANAPGSLADAILRIRQMPLEAMGGRGRVWIKEQYSAELQAAKMHLLYRQLIS